MIQDYNKEVIGLMKSIGFKYIKKTYTTDAVVVTYKYYPEYLQDKNYTLLVKRNKRNNSIEHRLYIYEDDKKYSSTIYQTSVNSIWNRNYIKDKVHQLFPAEVRMMTINEIIS